MKPNFARIAPLVLALLALAGCASRKKYDPAKARLNQFVDVPTAKLYDKALRMLHKKHRVWPFKKELHRTSRPRDMFAEVARRPDAGELRVLAEIRIADTYHIEGSDLAYSEAIARYKTFLQFHPAHPEAGEVQWQLSQCYYEQRSEPGRDQSMARNAETELEYYLLKYPGAAHGERARTQIAELKRARARHEMSVGDFYVWRKAPDATGFRLASSAKVDPSFAENPELALARGRHAVLKGDPAAARAELLSALSRPLAPDGRAGKWGARALQELRKLEKADRKARRKGDQPEPAAEDDAALRELHERAQRAGDDRAAAIAAWHELLARALDSQGRVSPLAGRALRGLGGLRLKKHGAALCWPNKAGCDALRAGLPAANAPASEPAPAAAPEPAPDAAPQP